MPQIASQSWGDSLPLGKCPRRWHRSPFPAGSALSEPSAAWLEPSGPHPRGLTAESQASTGRTPALCADHALLPAEGRGVGLTRSSLAWPPRPTQRGPGSGGAQPRPDSAVLRAKSELCPGAQRVCGCGPGYSGLEGLGSSLLSLFLCSSTRLRQRQGNPFGRRITYFSPLPAPPAKLQYQEVKRTSRPAPAAGPPRGADNRKPNLSIRARASRVL